LARPARLCCFAAQRPIAPIVTPALAMNLRQLEHVVALAEEGSFARAAQRVHLSQPALSRSIQSIEDGCATRLATNWNFIWSATT
jgi:hypothetical protein